MAFQEGGGGGWALSAISTTCHQGCQIFHGTNIPNREKITQLPQNVYKWQQNIPNTVNRINGRKIALK
jgi:hypothetical protein